jgi:protein-tyrosine-phosphatase
MAGSLGEHFFGGSNAEELSVDVAVNAVPGTNAKVTSGGVAPKVPPVETAVTVNAKPGLGLTVNSSGKPILAKLPDSKVDAIVTLTKNNWSTVVDWVTQAKGGDVKEGVELVKKGWTQIDKWAEAYKGGQLNQKIGLIKSGWSLISSWANKYTGGIVKKAVSLKRDGWTWVDAWVETFSGGTVQQGISLFVDNWSGFLTGVSNTLHSWFPNLFAEGGVIENGKVSRFRDGGVINAYAGGTSQTHGSLFLAGEAGPEIVGHVGGRTEVLNKSQIAATMYEAVRSAMTGITIDTNVYQGAYGEDGNEAMLELIMEGNSATQREIDILREQNNILRQLLEKPVTAEISTNGIVNALSRKNKRDGTTVVPVMY